jgi:acyl carrier protein
LSTSTSSGEIDNGWSARIVSLNTPGNSDMTRAQISDFCIVALANVLKIPTEGVATGVKFSRLGLDSAMVVYVMMELEEKLGLELSMDDFYDYPTVDELSRYLAEKRAARPAA